MNGAGSGFSNAVAQHKRGNLAIAEAGYRAVLRAEPRHAGAWHLLGVIAHQRGRHEEAVETISASIEIEPGRSNPRNNLALALLALGRADEALDQLREAIRLSPGYADAHSNLGLAFHRMGRPGEAIEGFEAALRLDPGHGDALFNLGNLLLERDRLDQAIESFRKAALIRPGRPDIWNNLGNAYLKAGQHDQAIEAYRRAIAEDGAFADARENLGTALGAVGRIEEARRIFGSLAEARPDDPVWPIRMAALCPEVFDDADTIEAYRDTLLAVLESHRGADLPWDDDAVASGCTPPFAVAHLGGDGRLLRERFAAIYRAPSPRPTPIRRGGPPRIGFAVTEGSEGVFLRCLGGVVTRLDPGRFGVAVFGASRGIDRLRRGIARDDVDFVAFPSDRVRDAAECIRAQYCDLIYHWEVGTSRLNYLLPFARAAPIQCTSWGIQTTTGHPAIDDYLSSDLVEVREADRHYSENLVRLPSLLSYHAQVRWPVPPARRAEFELPESTTLYGCLQRPMKLHPRFDDLIADLLRRDPKAQLILLAGRSARAAAALTDRFARKMPDVLDRIRLFAEMKADRYYRLLSLIEVVLDPRPYGMGSSAYDAFSFGLPVVTWPTSCNAGRYVRACYQEMRIFDLIAGSAEEYVSTASRLGTDGEYRREIRSQISRGSFALFEDRRAVETHETYFGQAVSGLTIDRS